MRRVEYLDGLRGLAALWVLIGHCMILTGFYLPVFAQPDLGVDLFILLSGYLMVFQYQLRQKFEDWERPGTWVSFWIRRFFRIAPLYYLMLAAALILGPMLYGHRVEIDSFFGRDLQAPQRYMDAGGTNIAMHLSFLFGLFPSYAFRTPLPDWSIGLEMQFYALFPLLVLLARKTSWALMAVLIGLAGVGIALLSMSASLSFAMPAFLPLKLHLFLCGMLTAVAAGAGQQRQRQLLHGGLLLLLAAIPIGGTQDLLHSLIREAIVVVFLALALFRRFRPVGMAARMLGTAPLHWLGELSFGVYLVHLLIMQPVAGWVVTTFGRDLSSPERFLMVLGIVAPLAYGIAYVSYRLVEIPGQHLGKALLRRASRNRPQASQTVAEEIAAP